MSKAWPVPNIEPKAPVATNARRILAVRMAEFGSYAPIVHSPTAVAELHNLRIATKRLRYTLELFPEVFGDLGEKQIERAKAIQQALGDLHDADVRLALIEEELQRLDESDSQDEDVTEIRHGLEGYLDRERQGRAAFYRAFVVLWERFTAEGMRRELTQLSSEPLDGSEPTPGVAEAGRA